MAMTEQEWLTCHTRPAEMLKLVLARSSQRKLRLFTCACARLLWNEQWDMSGLKAVEAAEAFADGLVSDADLAAAYSAIRLERHHLWPAGIVLETCNDVPFAAWHVNALCNLGRPKAIPSEKRAELLRCIFRPAAFRPVFVDQSSLAWNDSTVVKLAQAIYEERALPRGHLDAGRLAILADALEDAGCSNKDILSHCRTSGSHVRGCWVVDAILGKS